MSAEQARERLLETVERELTNEVARHVARAEESARLAADERARELVLRAMASVRGSVAVEGTISLVELPSDEMKGRIIGREGRNIRAARDATGVDLHRRRHPAGGPALVVGPDAARRSPPDRLQRLVEDGRIHPARIEEVVEKVRAEADEEARERGEAGAFELGITGLHARLVKLLGRLSFVTTTASRCSSARSEAALIAGELGDELRLSGDALQRAGLLHDVGGGDRQGAGTAPRDRPRRPRDEASASSRPSTHPIAAGPATTPPARRKRSCLHRRRIAVSAPRGRASDNLQRHIDRLEKVERMALAHEGVERAAAVQAGRELRVHVRAEAITDEQALLLARTWPWRSRRRSITRARSGSS